MKGYDIAAYVWPAYHDEPRLEHFWPEKEGEWYTVRRGTPRFPGHDMPRIPLLGFQDEADPKVMRQHVELALAYGINVFIVDWYWYENAPCFERQLNEGLIPALKGTDCKFYLMWANHDVCDLWNMHVDTHWNRVQWPGRVSRDALEPMFVRIIEKYFKLDSYYRVAGKPLFSIYEFPTLIAGLGDLETTRDALGWMRRRCIESGLSGIDLQTTITGLDGIQPDGTLMPGSRAAMGRALGFDSATSYQFCHIAGGSGDYVAWANRAIGAWLDSERVYGTYYPHVSIGWDNTQRNPSATAESVVANATPDAFEACLWKAKSWLDARPHQTPLVTINSWNEWTEGSYLLPDMRWGYGYLRAVRNVFGQK